MFRQLSEVEKNQFRQWARENYIPQTEINPVWHPVIQNECGRINEEIENNPAKCGSETLSGTSLERK